MAQAGYVADSAALQGGQLVATRPHQYVANERIVNASVLRLGPMVVERSGGWWITPDNYDWRPGNSRLTAGDPGLNVNQDLINRGYNLETDIHRYEFNARLAEYEKGDGTGFCFGGCGIWTIFGMADYGYNVYFKRYEDFKDYEYQWTGQWHDVTDRRQEFSYQWVTAAEDVYGTQPSYGTRTVTRPVVQEAVVNQWQSQMVMQPQTVFTTERILQTSPALPTAAFANESLRAGDGVTLLAGRDVSLSGLTRATNPDSAVVVQAARDVWLDGAPAPRGAAAATLAAVADLRAGQTVDVSGGHNVDMQANAILKADDGDPATVSGVIRLTAGQTLFVRSDAFGGHEIYLHSGGDVEMKAELDSGHLIDVRAGLGPDGIGSVKTDVNTDLATAGSEIHILAGPRGGDLLLTDAQIYTAGPLELSAPAGRHRPHRWAARGPDPDRHRPRRDQRQSGRADADCHRHRYGRSGVAGRRRHHAGRRLGCQRHVRLAGLWRDHADRRHGRQRLGRRAGLRRRDGAQRPALGGAGDVSLGSFTGDVTLGTILAAGTFSAQANVGAVTQAPGGSITAKDVRFTGVLPSSFDLAADELALVNYRPGDMTVNHPYARPLTLTKVYLVNGSLTVNTDGDLIVSDVRLRSDTGLHTVALTAGGNVAIDLLNVGDYAATPDQALVDAQWAALGFVRAPAFAARNDVTITAGGAITADAAADDTVDLIADQLTLRAGTDISGLELAVNAVLEATATAGTVTLTDADDVSLVSYQPLDLVLNEPRSQPLTLTQVILMDGWLTVNAAGDLIVKEVQLLSNTGAQAATLTAGGDVLIGLLNAGDYAATPAEADASWAVRGQTGVPATTSLNTVTVVAGGTIAELAAADDAVDLLAGYLTLRAGGSISGLGIGGQRIDRSHGDDRLDQPQRPGRRGRIERRAVGCFGGGAGRYGEPDRRPGNAGPRGDGRRPGHDGDPDGHQRLAGDRDRPPGWPRPSPPRPGRRSRPAAISWSTASCRRPTTSRSRRAAPCFRRPTDSTIASPTR